jgi:hypothetical protein
MAQIQQSFSSEEMPLLVTDRRVLKLNNVLLFPRRRQKIANSMKQIRSVTSQTVLEGQS